MEINYQKGKNAKRIYALLLSLAIIPAFPHNANGGKIIENHTGGEIREYGRQIHEEYKRGDVVEVRGICGSGCTLRLAAPNNCFHPDVKLYFHRAYSLDRRGRRVYNNTTRRVDKQYMELYPPEVQEMIREKGGLQKKLIIIPIRELPAKYLCERYRSNRDM